MDDGIVFDSDVIKKDIVHPAVINIHDVDGGMGCVDDIAVAEYNPAQVLGARFGADLERFPPIVPYDAVLKQNVLAGVVAIAGVALRAERIVVSAHEAAGNARVAAVVEVYSVGVVTPTADDLAVLDRNIAAAEAGDVVN